MAIQQKKSIERKLIPFNYSRIYDCPKGALRVLILIFFLLELVPLIACIHDYRVDTYYHGSAFSIHYSGYLFFIPFEIFNYSSDETSGGIMLYVTYFLASSIILYYSYWTFIRIYLWIFDGFKENK